MLALSIAGCDDSFVDPFENQEYYYTVFGYLDILEIDHSIRVIPITRSSAVVIDPAQAEAFIDAEVFTTEVERDITHEWEHHLEKLADGTYGHVFRQSFVAQPGKTYRLDVVRSDGMTATAFTTMPHLPDSSVFNINPVQFREDSTRLLQQIHIPEIGAPWDIEAVYRWSDGQVARRIFVPYGRAGSTNDSAGGWNVTLDLSSDQSFVRDHIREQMTVGSIFDDTPITLATVGLRIRMLNPDWDLPIDPYDPKIYAFPETLSNVENGYGYFGSLGVYTQEWDICEFSQALGYEPGEADCSIR